MQDCQAHMGVVEGKAGDAFSSCFHLLSRVSEVDSMVRVLHLVTVMLEALGPKAQPHFAAITAALPQVGPKPPGPLPEPPLPDPQPDPLPDPQPGPLPNPFDCSPANFHLPCPPTCPSTLTPHMFPDQGLLLGPLSPPRMPPISPHLVCPPACRPPTCPHTWPHDLPGAPTLAPCQILTGSPLTSPPLFGPLPQCCYLFPYLPPDSAFLSGFFWGVWRAIHYKDAMKESTRCSTVKAVHNRSCRLPAQFACRQTVKLA